MLVVVEAERLHLRRKELSWAMFNVRWWTWRRQILLGQRCITKLVCVIVWLSSLLKKWGLEGGGGSPLNRFFYNGEVWTPIHGQMQSVWGRFEEKGNHGSWYSARDNNSIFCTAWSWINISYSHPRDWNVQVWRGRVKTELKQQLVASPLWQQWVSWKINGEQRSIFAITGNYLKKR